MKAMPQAVGEGGGRRRWGIGQLLVVLVLAALAPFVLLEIYRGVADVVGRRAAVIQQARGQVQEEAETMEDFLRFTERYLATLAADPAVYTLDRPRAAELFEAVRTINPNFVNVFLLSMDGEQLVSTEPLVRDPDIVQRPYFQEALSSDRMTISSVLAWRDTDYSVVVLAKRVNRPDGSPVGVLCIALNLARLSTVIGYVALPPGSVVLLAQRDGTILAASDEPEGWVGQSLAGIDLFERAWSRDGGSGTATLPDGVARVLSYETLRSVPWVMLAAIPQSEVDAVSRDRLRAIAAEMALAAAATALLSWIVLRRVVVPIRMLSDGARAFAAGFLNRRVPVHRRDELGDLAEALNRMAASLERRLEEEAAHAAALQRLNQLQAEFVATASHELRTPVTAIRTYAEALLRPDIIDEETRRDCLEGINRSSERLARLVRTLLDVSRIDSGRVEVRPGPVDVAAVVRAAIAQAAPGDSGDNVIVDIPADLPPVQADADRLEDVLANLIDNARKFSPPGAPIQVRATATPDELCIAVEDHGVGIPASELAHIFDRFYQVQRGPGRNAGGSGLGLYIAHAYVAAMQGRIWAESVPGAGSTFFVALPVAERTPTAAGPGDQDAQPAGRAHR